MSRALAAALLVLLPAAPRAQTVPPEYMKGFPEASAPEPTTTPREPTVLEGAIDRSVAGASTKPSVVEDED